MEPGKEHRPSKLQHSLESEKMESEGETVLGL